jgi:hypothetical protein
MGTIVPSSKYELNCRSEAYSLSEGQAGVAVGLKDK